MLDLALSSDLHAADGLFLVAPDAREGEVRAQLRRPASVASPICRCATYHMTIWKSTATLSLASERELRASRPFHEHCHT